MTEHRAPDQHVGFTDVDASDDPDVLLKGMDATAQWPAVQQLHAWSGERLSGARALLDVGCGQGFALLRLARAAGSGRFVGIDTSEAMLAQARERAAAAGIDATFETASALDLPFGDDEFDAVRCERVLQWLHEPAAAVAEMVRVVRPGGRVVLLDTDWRTFGTTVDRDLEVKVLRTDDGFWPSPHAGGFLRHWAVGAGLTDVQSTAAVHHATGFAGDGSDGLFPRDMLIEARIAAGVDREDVTRFVDEVAAQAAAGTLSMVLTMWGVAGTVPG